MSKFVNALGVTALTALLFVSCSILSPKGNITSAPAAAAVDSLTTDSLDRFTPQIDSVAIDAIDSLSLDSLICDSLIVAQDSIQMDSLEMQQEIDMQEMFQFHFEGSETSAVMTDEFRNSVVEDMIINLGEENSYYPADGHVTSSYGWRGRRMHGGIDLKAYTGDNLYAAFDGVVRLSKYYSSFGNCIIIRHYNGLETLYAHASKRFVEVNDVVKAGDIIALAGNTGRSTGSHLHFEVRAGGHYFNPTYILDTENRKIKDANLYITMRNGRLFASNNDNEQEREAYILQQISIRYHTVRSGDTLSRIAVNNGTTVATICRLNGISSKSILRIGQRLIVRDGIKPPAKTTTTTTAKSTAPADSSAKSAPASTSGSASTSIYTVRSGDNLSTIAKRHGTTVAKICSLNGISSRSTLSIGQKLRLSDSAQAESSAAASQQSQGQGQSSSGPEYYRVKKGDTLSGIAKRHGTTVSKLCSLNGISSTSTLQIKQNLRIR